MKDFRIGPHLNLDNPSDELFEGCENIVDFADIDIQEIANAIANSDNPFYHLDDEKLCGLFGKQRIFGKDSVFHHAIDKLKSHKGLKQKLIQTSSKVGEWMLKKLLGKVAPEVGDTIADKLDEVAQRKINQIDHQEGKMGNCGDIATIRK